MSKLKPWVKIALITVVVFGLLFLFIKTNSRPKGDSKSSGGVSSLFGGDKDVFNVGVNTYAGFLQLV